MRTVITDVCHHARKHTSYALTFVDPCSVVSKQPGSSKPLTIVYAVPFVKNTLPFLHFNFVLQVSAEVAPSARKPSLTLTCQHKVGRFQTHPTVLGRLSHPYNKASRQKALTGSHLAILNGKGHPLSSPFWLGCGYKVWSSSSHLDHDAHHPRVEADRVGFDCYLDRRVLLIPGGWDT